MKKVLVTGANGFVGSYCVKYLIEHGYNVISLIHHSYNRLVGIDTKIIESDISDRFCINRISEEIGECEFLIHLAADIRVPGDDISIINNELGTYNIGLIARMLNTSKIVYLSSIPLIGVPCQLPINENHPVMPLTIYHETKLAGEVILSQLCSDKIVVSLRAASPIGIGMNPNNYLSFLISCAQANKPITLYGQGQRVQNYIDVRDLCSALLNSLNVGESDTYVLPGYQSISNLELAKRVISITGSNSIVQFAGMPDIHEQEKWILDGSKIKADLGYVPEHPLEETIKWIIGG